MKLKSSKAKRSAAKASGKKSSKAKNPSTKSSQEKSSTPKARVTKCPRCGKWTEYSPANKYRPFCSERCQLIDLGEWASEKYSLPVEEDKSSEDEADDGEI